MPWPGLRQRAPASEAEDRVAKALAAHLPRMRLRDPVANKLAAPLPMATAPANSKAGRRSTDSGAKVFAAASVAGARGAEEPADTEDKTGRLPLGGLKGAV
mmetsp:Transcript_60964/g.170537  ORF Transcript_60964/g.170537 Transcript_60964/m.170537 type:complete len:101 (-) Transcript_60964:176-478(-)